MLGGSTALAEYDLERTEGKDERASQTGGCELSVDFCRPPAAVVKKGQAKMGDAPPNVSSKQTASTIAKWKQPEQRLRMVCVYVIHIHINVYAYIKDGIH